MSTIQRGERRLIRLAGIILALSLVLPPLYWGVAVRVFQWRNPKSNDMACIRHCVDVLLWRRLARFQ